MHVWAYMTHGCQMPAGTPIFDMDKTPMRSRFSFSMSLNKKLIFLVMIVSCVTMVITGGLSFTYADQILKERVADQLIGESAVRGETVRILMESHIMHNDVLAGEPVIRALVSHMNQASAEERNAMHKVVEELCFLIMNQRHPSVQYCLCHRLASPPFPAVLDSGL